MADLYNVEIKARARDVDRMRAVLEAHHARVVGRFRQVDTYFDCPDGRLKLRESGEGDELIFYRRDDRPGPKSSDIVLERLAPGHDLKHLLTSALGVRVVVDKMREIFFVDNVKFHIDEVQGLGGFIEIEAIDDSGALGHDHLLAQCERFMEAFGVQPEDLLSTSYSDLVSEQA